MSRWTIYFWEPCISPHKLALFRGLLADERVDHCVYVTQEVLPADRVAQGWLVGDTDGLDIRIAPSETEVRQIIADAPSNAIHLFSCIHWIPCVVQGIRAAVAVKARFAIMAEPRVREGVKGLARLAHSWLTERHVRRHAGFVLAIGRNGPSWFRRAGYRRDRIFPFAYFLPALPSPAVASANSSDGVSLRIGYLGRLIKPKGFDLFLAAMPLLRQAASVVIAGGGADRSKDIATFAKKMPGAVDFRGTIAMTEVAAFLAEIDILVLPSLTTDDGWGAVVSEALMAGAAVVATDRVGASICLDNPMRGAVARSLDPADLARVVDTVATRPGLADAAQRAQRRAWALDHLTGTAGATYALKIIEHVYGDGARPIAFYEDPQESEGT